MFCTNVSTVACKFEKIVDQRAASLVLFTNEAKFIAKENLYKGPEIIMKCEKPGKFDPSSYSDNNLLYLYQDDFPNIELNSDISLHLPSCLDITKCNCRRELGYKLNYTVEVSPNKLLFKLTIQFELILEIEFNILNDKELN